MCKALCCGVSTVTLTRITQQWNCTTAKPFPSVWETLSAVDSLPVENRASVHHTSLPATPSLPFWPSPLPCLHSEQAVTLAWELPADAGGGLRKTQVCRLEPCWVPARLLPAGPAQSDGEERRGTALELGERQEQVVPSKTTSLTGSPEAIPGHNTNEVFKPHTVQLHVHFTTLFSFSACNNHIRLPRWVTVLLFYKWGNWGFSDTARKGPTLDRNPDVAATSQCDVIGLTQRVRRASPHLGSCLLSFSKTTKASVLRP